MSYDEKLKLTKYNFTWSGTLSGFIIFDVTESRLVYGAAKKDGVRLFSVNHKTQINSLKS